MYQGCIFLVKPARVILCAENLFICAKQCCLNLKYYLLCGCLSIMRDGELSSSAPVLLVLGFSGINLSALFPMLGSFEGGAQPNEQGNRTIMLEHSHLAIEFYNFKFRRSPWYSEDRVRGAIHALAGQSRLFVLSGISRWGLEKPLEQRPALASS